ncbi:MAG: UDP-glucose/GDP-mannose dehydrogenase family protein [Candidatus Gracilibacteria bacterium]|nr:UDP-glucose/GDP-mannose dehydrogenase family protein [Candidatus Gracilibacteria bacterium]
MKITIFGTGYVGLVTGTCLAEVGHEVMCIDIDQNKIDKLKEGIIPIYEPGLEELVKRNYKEGRLQFSTDAKQGIDFATAIFSAVGTPPDENHRADLRFVKIVAQTLGQNMDNYKVFINKSTVPVGTGEMCKNIIKEELKKRKSPLLGGDLEGGFDVVSNPEFLKEGAAVKDFMTPDRIVCGVESEQAKKVMNDIYKSFIRADKPLVFTDLKSSEIIKYAANSFLATKISFINEIANFAEIVGANISDISKGIGLDPRIGSKFLHAGIGYGGSCFPKDVQALIETGKDFGYDFKIIKATEEVNKLQKVKIVDMLLEKIKHIHSQLNSEGLPLKSEEINYFPLANKTIAIWGLAFKPKTDDIRDAPSLDVIDRLIGLGVSKIQAFDPVAMENVSRVLGGESKLTLTYTNYEALKGADALLVLTEWDEFRNADFDKIVELMRGNIIIDGRNIWNKDDLIERGFNYEGIGK